MTSRDICEVSKTPPVTKTLIITLKHHTKNEIKQSSCSGDFLC